MNISHFFNGERFLQWWYEYPWYAKNIVWCYMYICLCKYHDWIWWVFRIQNLISIVCIVSSFMVKSIVYINEILVNDIFLWCEIIFHIIYIYYVYIYTYIMYVWHVSIRMYIYIYILLFLDVDICNNNIYIYIMYVLKPIHSGFAVI
jgi:hypothetical protein